VRPTWFLIGCMGGVFVISLLQISWLSWPILLAAVVGFAVVDGIGVSFRRKFKVERTVPSAVSVFKKAKVQLTISHEHRAKIYVSVVDHCPPDLSSDFSTFTGWIDRGHRVTLSYEIKPTTRGLHRIDSVGFLIRSPLGLWWKRIRISESSQIRVYPDFASITKYLELLHDQRTSTLGMKQIQRRGSGMEFQQLRDYRQGDALNWIDWNATSKRRTLISREFEDERNQTLIFLLDTGRRLRSKDDELSHFDHTLNAMMLLSYIALRQGDLVGVLCFGKHNRWIQPVSGVVSMKRILNSVFDLDSGPVTSDYVDMAEQLERVHRKRAMTMLLTNIRDEDYELNDALRTIRKRHVVVLANLRERALEEVQRQDISSFQDALASVGATNYLQERENLQYRCAKNCHMVVDSVPQELHVDLANAYWTIKRAGKL